MSRVPQPQDNRLVSWEGRRFAKFAIDNDVSCVPVDEPEEENFDEVLDVFRRLFGRVVLPPLSLQQIDEPHVLDCGYGSGQWIDSILESTQGDAWCVGLDIYTGQRGHEEDSDEEDSASEAVTDYVEKRWNLNASFRTASRDDEDLKPETYHLINSRFLTDGINANRWADYVKELKILLEPKGWLQMVEAHNLFQSDSGQTPPFLDRWWQYYQDTMTRMGKNPRVGSTLGTLMTNAGFERVHYSVERLPIGEWMPSKAEIGEQARNLVSKMIRSVTLWPFLRRANPRLTMAQYEALIQGAEQELKQDSLKLYVNIHLAYGRRPASRKR